MNPLAKKLKIKPGKRWLFFNVPDSYLSKLEPLPDSLKTSFELKGKFDGAQIFVTSSQEFKAVLKGLIPVLANDAVLWITFPKKNSSIKTDFNMMSGWEEAAKYGFKPVSSAAIDETWTALRFRSEDLSKNAEIRNDNIRQNEFGEYIDVDNKVITLPPVIHTALKENSGALNFYQSLSYTNKKEYVLWILTAKQEKTREERLLKLVEKLAEGKKNPSEK
jgi:hypothetical protein